MEKVPNLPSEANFDTFVFSWRDKAALIIAKSIETSSTDIYSICLLNHVIILLQPMIIFDVSEN